MITAALATAVLIIGCGYQAEPAEEYVPDSGVLNVMKTPAPVETAQPAATPEPTPTPEPDFEAGYFQKQYTDPQTGSYLYYWAIVPEGATKNMPMIVYLNGDGLCNRFEQLVDADIAKMTEEIYGDEFPFILIMPNNSQPEWYNDGMGALVKGLIDQAAEEYSADMDKIILTGHSRGAIAVWQLVNDYGTFFNCAVPVSCGAQKIYGENFIGVPVRAMVGGWEGDEIYSKEIKSFVSLINQAGGNAEMIQYEQFSHGQMSTEAYTAETFVWMLSQGE